MTRIAWCGILGSAVLIISTGIANQSSSDKSSIKSIKRFLTMKSAVFALLGLLAGTASAVELTPDNFDELTAGKTVFIKFLAPWYVCK